MLSVNDKLSDTDAVGIGRKGTIDKPLYLKAPFGQWIPYFIAHLKKILMSNSSIYFFK